MTPLSQPSGTGGAPPTSCKDDSDAAAPVAWMGAGWLTLGSACMVVAYLGLHWHDDVLLSRGNRLALKMCRPSYPLWKLNLPSGSVWWGQLPTWVCGTHAYHRRTNMQCQGHLSGHIPVLSGQGHFSVHAAPSLHSMRRTEGVVWPGLSAIITSSCNENSSIGCSCSSML